MPVARASTAKLAHGSPASTFEESVSELDWPAKAGEQRSVHP